MRLLICASASNFCHGGVERYLVDRLIRMNTAGFDITLVVPGKVVAHDWIELLEDRAGCPLEVVELDVMERGKALQVALTRQKMRRILRSKRYDVVHVNTGSLWLQAVCLECAKQAGVSRRIAHSHNSLTGVRRAAAFSDALFRRAIVASATDCVACSNQAGIWLFGETTWKGRGVVLRNGIDTGRYAFDATQREAYRKGSEDAIVIGTVGRLDDQKNQSFLLEVFAEVAAIDRAVKLWIVGDGPLKAELEGLAGSLGVSDSVTFWGARNDVSSLLQGMDVFVLPSLYEGLPLSLLEAQANGLPCVVSETVSEEASVEGCFVKRLPIDAPLGVWAKTILESTGLRILNAVYLLCLSGYGIEESVRALEELYGIREPLI